MRQHARILTVANQKEDNAALVEERDGYLRQLRARIKWLTRGIQEFEKAIVYMRDRIANRGST